jgi:hypothetical protein
MLVEDLDENIQIYLYFLFLNFLTKLNASEETLKLFFNNNINKSLKETLLEREY